MRSVSTAPESLTSQFEEMPVPVPGPGEAVVKLEAIGLNYIEVYQRTGLYHSLSHLYRDAKAQALSRRLEKASHS